MLIGIVAGETSGDLLGAELIRELRRVAPSLTFVGIGGPQMQSAGCALWHHAEELAVRGYAEVLRHLPRLLRLRRRFVARLGEARPDLFIGIDAPDFNLGVEARLKRRGVPTLHYVSPSLWAWRGERMKAIKAAVDHMLVLFPFERALYEAAGVPVDFVGHPLADLAPLESARATERARLKLDPEQAVIALLPGSRQSELELHADLFVTTAQRIAQALPEVRFLVPLATRETRNQFEMACHERGAGDLPLSLLYGHAGQALAAADVALVASGTATLEAALYRCPQVVTYRLKPSTYRLVKRRLRLPYVALPNVLCGRFVVPEILQDAASEENLAQAVLNLYADRVLRARMETRFASLQAELRQGNAQRAAQAVLGLLQRRGAA